MQNLEFDQSTGYQWQTNTIINTTGWIHGYYIVSVADLNGAVSEYPFIIKNPTAPKILLVASTNTWEAYSSFQGISYYRNTFYQYGIYQFVAHQRPFGNNLVPAQSCVHTVGAEWYLYEWLLDHGYNFGVISDRNLDFNKISGATILILIVIVSIGVFGA